MPTLKELTDRRLTALQKGGELQIQSLGGLDMGTQTTTSAVAEEGIPSTIDIAREVIKSPITASKASFRFARDAAQGIARSGGSVGLSMLGLEEFEPTEDSTALEKITYRTLFGKEPLESVGRRIEKFPDRAEAWGIDREFATEIAPLTIIGLTSMDFLGFGGARKGAVETLAKLKNVDEVKNILRSVKIPETIIDDVAETVAKETNPAKIDSLIKGRLNDYVSAGGKLEPAKAKIAEEVPEVAEKIKPSITPPKIVKQEFRIDKLNLSTEQATNITKRLEALGLTTRTVRTFEEVSRAAQELGIDSNKLLREVSNSRITDAEVKALRDIIASSADDVIRVQKELTTTADEGGQRLLNIKLAETQRIIDEALKKLIKGGTESGRAVSAFRLEAERTLDPAYWLLRAGRLMEGRKMTIETTAAIMDLIQKGDKQGLANFLSMLRNPKWEEQVITVWKAGLLTSPTTHLANIGGNITMAGLMSASDVVSTSLDVLVSLATGQRTVTTNLGVLTAKVKGTVRGIGYARDYLKNGFYSPDVLKRYDINHNVVFKHKIFDIYTQTIFRALGAEDVVFRMAALEESFEKSAQIIAKNEGLVGDAARARIKELLIKPTNEMVVESVNAAEYATFQVKNPLADMISGAKAASPRTLRTIIDFIVPFTTTPANIAARLVDFSPIGFIKAIVQFARPSTRSQKNLVEDLGRAITGTGIIAFGAYLGKKGIMTGNAPPQGSKRDMFFAQGKQPNSILIGDHWLQLNRVSPVGNLLGLGAEFHELGEDYEGVGRLGQTAFAGIKGLSEQTFLKGVSSAVKVINEPEYSLGKWWRQSVTSLIPSVIGRTATMIDPRMRVSDNIWDALGAKIPGVSFVVPPQRDIWGEIVKAKGGRLNMFDPFQSTRAKNDPIVNEFERVGAVVGMPEKAIYGVKLDSREYSLYQKVQGRILRAHLQGLIESPNYEALNEVDKESALTGMTRAVRTELNKMMFPVLMIQKYDLPKSTNPEAIRILIPELMENSKFKHMNDEKKGKVIQKALEQLAL